MAVVSKTVLKSYFEDGKEPDENKYIDLIDTMGTTDMDHGGLTGLGDDDHSQYILADGSRWFSTSAVVIDNSGSTTDLVLRNTNASYLARLRFDDGSGVKGIIQVAGDNMSLYTWTGQTMAFHVNDSSSQRQVVSLYADTSHETMVLGLGDRESHFRLNTGNAKYSFLEFQKGGVARWRWSKDNDSETGSNAGASLSLYRYSDAGGYLGRPIQVVRATGDIYFNDGDIRTAGGLSVGNTGVDPAVGDIKAQGNITANGSFYGQNAYYYEGGTYMGDFTAQDTTWFRINQGVAKNIYTPRYFAAAAGLQAGGSTNPGSGYVGYTAGLRPNKNSTQYYTYGYFGSASYYSSTSWDGDAKGDTAGTKIDLSAVFGVPAAVKAVNMRIIGKANNAGPTDSHYFFCGPSPTYDAHSGVYLWGNVYMSETGIVSCDGNGDIYYTISSSATCYCIIRILGYFI